MRESSAEIAHHEKRGLFVRGFSFLAARLMRLISMLRAVRVHLFVHGVELESVFDAGIQSGCRFRVSGGGGVRIGRKVDLCRGAEITANRGAVAVGDGTFIGAWSTIVARHQVSIGRDCLIAERVTIRDQDHATGGSLDVPIAQAGFDTAPITIGDDVWIAAGTVILKGVTIGRGAVVAANAVVNRDVAPYEIVGGVPARRIGMRQGPEQA